MNDQLVLTLSWRLWVPLYQNIELVVPRHDLKALEQTDL